MLVGRGPAPAGRAGSRACERVANANSRFSTRCAAHKNTRIQLATSYTAPFGDSLLLVSEVTGWSADKGQPLSWSEGDVWKTELDVPAGTFEFKLAVRRGSDGDLWWQPGENRCLQVPSDPAILRVEVSWDGEAAVEVVQPGSQGADEPPARPPAACATPDEQVSASEAAVQPEKQPAQQDVQAPKAVQAANRSRKKAAARPILRSSLSKPLEELTLKEIKEVLKAAGLGVTGVKQVLLARLEDNLI